MVSYEGGRKWFQPKTWVSQNQWERTGEHLGASQTFYLSKKNQQQQPNSGIHTHKTHTQHFTAVSPKNVIIPFLGWSNISAKKAELTEEREHNSLSPAVISSFKAKLARDERRISMYGTKAAPPLREEQEEEQRIRTIKTLFLHLNRQPKKTTATKTHRSEKREAWRKTREVIKRRVGKILPGMWSNLYLHSSHQRMAPVGFTTTRGRDVWKTTGLDS